MPMILELVVAMLACARVGAVHSVVVGTLSVLLSELSCWGRAALVLGRLGEEGAGKDGKLN